MKLDEKEYLEHFGTKGMKWGVRKAKIGGAGVAAGLVARHYLINKKLPSAALLGTAGFAIAGSVAAKAYLDRNGDKKLSDLNPPKKS